MKSIKHLFVVVSLTVGLVTSVLAADAERGEIKAKIESVQTQLDQLVDQGGRYVYLQLAQKNGLDPFAVGVDSKGDILMLEVPQTEKDATFKDKILVLRETLQASAKKGVFEAAALFVQAQIPHKGVDVDGVAIEMEHKGGLSVIRFSPYEIDRENKSIDFKKPIDQIKPVVFFKHNN